MDGWQLGPAQELRRAFILDDTRLGPIHWYCPGKSAAVVLSVDDIFPGTSQSAYEAGGDLEGGELGRLLWLLERHPQLQLTLFVTPDWRRISPVADRLWRHVPWLRDRVYLSSVLPRGRWTFVTIRSSSPFSMRCRALKSRYMACTTSIKVTRSPSNFRIRTVPCAPACWLKQSEFSKNPDCSMCGGFNPLDGIAALRFNKHAVMSESNGWHPRGISERPSRRTPRLRCRD